MNELGFSRQVFEALPREGAEMLAAIRRHAGPDALRILEIGCGGGEQLVAIATALPHCKLVGIELSSTNVDLARRRAANAGVAGRVVVRHDDYIDARGLGNFDVIVAESVLHLIEHPDAEVFDRIARDLVPGGLLVGTLPYEGIYNRVLSG